MNTALPLMLIGAATASLLAVADIVPQLNVAPGCKAAVTVNKAIDMSESQSYDNCMRDENSARSELQKNWASYPSVVRERCTAETKEGGDASYVELLTCVQIAQDPTSKALLQGAKQQKK
jgi:hypothetical protein